MAKPFRGFVPKATKGELVAAAKEQAKQEVTVAGTAKTDEPVAVELPSEQVVVVNDVGTMPAEVAAPTEAPAAPAPPPAPKAKDDSGLFALGKKYAPKTDRNSETWGKITKALGEGPKTLKELSEVVKGHADFIGYMTRGGHIVPHVAQEAKQA